jgi:Na+/alanine symporter
MEHRVLCITPFANAIPYYLYSDKNPNSFLQTIVRILIPFLAISTILFWYNPIQHSCIHLLDKGIVILFSLVGIGYVLFFKKMQRMLWVLYGMVLALGTYFGILSKYYSSRDWCCTEHIQNHLGFHFCAHLHIWFVFF